MKKATSKKVTTPKELIQELAERLGKVVGKAKLSSRLQDKLVTQLCRLLADVRRAQGVAIRCCCYFGPGIPCQNMYRQDCIGTNGGRCIGLPCLFPKLILSPPPKKSRRK